jgi:hypothetical protein
MGSNRDFAAPLPGIALTAGYRDAGDYTDCFVTDVARNITLREFIEAFYTTWVFRLERWILALLVSRPSTDAEVMELAAGARDTFAAWCVEARRDDQLLLTDYRGSTRSWLMVEPARERTPAATALPGAAGLPPPVFARAPARRTAAPGIRCLSLILEVAVVPVEVARELVLLEARAGQAVELVGIDDELRRHTD